MIVTMTIFFSHIAFAGSYDCLIAKNDLPVDLQEAGIDVPFSVTLDEGDGLKPEIVFYEDTFERCSQEDASTVICRDAEGMPYLVEVLAEDKAKIAVGFFIPETIAACTKSK